MGGRLLRSALTFSPIAMEQVLPHLCTAESPVSLKLFKVRKTIEDLVKLVWEDHLLSGIHFSTTLPLQHLPSHQFGWWITN